jgi:hypothetical protein
MFEEVVPKSERVELVPNGTDLIIPAYGRRSSILFQNQSTSEICVRELRNEADMAAGTVGGTVGVVLGACSVGKRGDGGARTSSSKRQFAVRSLGANLVALHVVEEE